jgi:hypothetical protein
MMILKWCDDGRVLVGFEGMNCVELNDELMNI